MKITKRELRQMINESVRDVLNKEEFAFVPRRRNDSSNKVRKTLMNGKIIRYDAKHNYVEVLPRTDKGNLSRMGNLHDEGQRYYYGENYIEPEMIQISQNSLYKLIEELEEEYEVIKVRCEESGCCQYATFGVYLEG